MLLHREMIAQAKDWMLFPFYIAVVFFFICFQPIASLPEESLLAAICKVVPIWCLAGYVYRRGLHPNGTEDPYIPSVLLALLLSSVGDVFMLFRSSCLPLGIIAFILAQTMYVIGLKTKQDPQHRKSVVLFANLFVVLILACHANLDPFSTALLCPYFGLIMTVGAMTSCWFEKEGSIPALWGVFGALLFIISDSLIVFETITMTDYSLEFMVMVLYYAAQFSFALSTLP